MPTGPGEFKKRFKQTVKKLLSRKFVISDRISISETGEPKAAMAKVDLETDGVEFATHGVEGTDKVPYYTAEQQKLALATYKSGVLFKGNEQFDTTGYRSKKDILNTAAYVMDSKGSLYIARHITDTQPDDLKTSHAGILDGKSVICAGLITIKDGKITELDNDSGHYKPDEANLYSALVILKDKGVFAIDAKIYIFPGMHEYTVDAVIEYLKPYFENRVLHDKIDDLFLSTNQEHDQKITLLQDILNKAGTEDTKEYALKLLKEVPLDQINDTLKQQLHSIFKPEVLIKNLAKFAQPEVLKHFLGDQPDSKLLEAAAISMSERPIHLEDKLDERIANIKDQKTLVTIVSNLLEQNSTLGKELGKQIIEEHKNDEQFSTELFSYALENSNYQALEQLLKYKTPEENMNFLQENIITKRASDKTDNKLDTNNDELAPCDQEKMAKLLKFIANKFPSIVASEEFQEIMEEHILVKFDAAPILEEYAIREHCTPDLDFLITNTNDEYLPIIVEANLENNPNPKEFFVDLIENYPNQANAIIESVMNHMIEQQIDEDLSGQLKEHCHQAFSVLIEHGYLIDVVVANLENNPNAKDFFVDLIKNNPNHVEKIQDAVFHHMIEKEHEGKLTQELSDRCKATIEAIDASNPTKNYNDLKEAFYKTTPKNVSPESEQSGKKRVEKLVEQFSTSRSRTQMLTAPSTPTQRDFNGSRSRT